MVIAQIYSFQRRLRAICGLSGTRFSLSAIRPSSAIEAAFILCIKLLRWTFTVVSLMPRSPAYLLTETALCHLKHYFPLATTQCFETLLERARSLFLLLVGTILRKRKIDRIEKVLLAKWLGQELNGASLHRLHRHRDIAVSGNKNDRELDIGCSQLALKFQTARPRQPYIKHKTSRPFGTFGPKKVRNEIRKAV